MRSEEHEQFAWGLVRGIFDCLDTTEIKAEGAFASQREAAEHSLRCLSPEELEDQLGDAVQILEGFRHAADVMNACTLMVLTDAYNRARMAHRGAKLAAGMELDELDDLP